MMNKVVISACFFLSVASIPATPSAFPYNQQAKVKKEEERTKDSLQPYLSCVFKDGLKIVEKDRRSNSGEPYREVQTKDGKKRVSVIDGYRLMFAYPDTHYFANVKVEQSNPQEYDRDKENVISELEYYSSSKNSATKIAFTGPINYNGYTIYGVERDTIDKVNLIGMNVIFSDTDHVIITAYFTNQKKRKFQTLDEFKALREQFLNQYTSCIKDNFTQR